MKAMNHIAIIGAMDRGQSPCHRTRQKIGVLPESPLAMTGTRPIPHLARLSRRVAHTPSWRSRLPI